MHFLQKAANIAPELPAHPLPIFSPTSDGSTAGMHRDLRMDVPTG